LTATLQRIALKVRIWTRRGLVEASLRPSDLIDLRSTQPFTGPTPGRIAVHVHAFYPELVMEVAQYLQHLPFLYDLYVSAPDEKARAVCQEVFSELPQVRQLEVRVVENRGRDIAPMVCEFGRLLKQYDFICHIHTKKSTHADAAMAGWREYLFHQLLGSEKQIRKIFSRFADSSRLGIVYPQGFHRLPYWGYTWLSNRPLAREWRHRLGIADMPEGYLDFPAGSMFWARGPALEPLFDAGITLADFPEEAGQTDGTLAHCLERLLALVPKRLGFQAEVIQDTRYPSWSNGALTSTYLATNTKWKG